MVFHYDKKKVLYPKLFIGAIEIERVDYFNFLGLQLNHTLKWNKQFSCVNVCVTKDLKKYRPITYTQTKIRVSYFHTKINL